MTSEKLTIFVHKLLCPADKVDLLKGLRSVSPVKRKCRCKPTYSTSVPVHISWCQLQALIDTKVSLGGFDADIEYIDDEGDCVAISGNDELREAVKVGLKNDNKELRLLLYHYKRKSRSAEMLRRNSAEKLERAKRELIRLQPAIRAGAIYDSESGEKSHQLPDKDQPPKWFLAYMEKFKTDMTQDVAERVSKKTVRKLAHTMPDLTDGAKRKEKKTNSVTHDAICDNCNTSIAGVRFKCGNCDDYDLCEKCESEDPSHDPDHVFIKIRRPAHFSGRKKGRTAPLLKRSIYYVDPMKDIRRISKMPIVEPIDLSEKYGRRLHHEKRTEKLKRRHEVQRDAPYKREKLSLCTWLKAQESAETLVLGTKYKEPYGCCFVRDESIPDETHLQPGTKFTKKWVMRNTGLNAWDDNVQFVMLWGSLPVVVPESGEEGAPVTRVPHLAPDEEATLAVEMLAPGAPGSYQNHWSLQYAGRCFGHRVWCSIVVDAKQVLESPGKVSSLEIIDKNEYEPVDGDTETNEESGEVCIVPRKEEEEEEDTREGEPLSYEIVKNEEELLKVPVSKASQTATPNNTPLASSPPKSPAPELELAARRLVVSTSLEAVAERCEKECQNQMECQSKMCEKECQTRDELDLEEKMAELVLQEELDILSYSESDSDSDYCVVPLPHCFDTSTPLTMSTTDSNVVIDIDNNEDSDDDCVTEKSFDLVSHESRDDAKETALKMGYDLADEQPEIELQDMSDKRSDSSGIADELSAFSDFVPVDCTEPHHLKKKLNVQKDEEKVLNAPIPPPRSQKRVLKEPAVPVMMSVVPYEPKTVPLVSLVRSEPICTESRASESFEPVCSEHSEETCSVKTEVVVKNEDSGEEVLCLEEVLCREEVPCREEEREEVSTENGEREMRVVRAPVPPVMHAVQETTEELDPDQTLVKQIIESTVEAPASQELATVEEIRSSENGEVIRREARPYHQGEHRNSGSPGLEDFVNAAFEAAGTAASSAIHAAKDVVSMLKHRSQYVPPQSTWTPPASQYHPPQSQWIPDRTDDQDAYSDVSDDENVYPMRRETNRDPTAMETLLDMGFANRELNERLLRLHENDINKVVTEILSTEGEWFHARH